MEKGEKMRKNVKMRKGKMGRRNEKNEGKL